MPRILKLYHYIGMDKYTCRWAWLPELCQSVRSQCQEWRWMCWYWKRTAGLTGKTFIENVTPARMGELVEEEKIKINAAAFTNSSTAGSVNHHSGIVMRRGTRKAIDQDLEANIRAIVEEYIYELEKKFMDELFASLPANTVPQEQIDRIYEKMGYERT